MGADWWTRVTLYAAKDKHRPLMVVELICKADGLPMPVPEHVFAKGRRFRFDWAWLDPKVALEIDGAVWVNGRHTRGAGFMKDQEKTNLAIVHGWRVFRCTPQTIHIGMAFVRQVLSSHADGTPDA